MQKKEEEGSWTQPGNHRLETESAVSGEQDLGRTCQWRQRGAVRGIVQMIRTTAGLWEQHPSKGTSNTHPSFQGCKWNFEVLQRIANGSKAKAVGEHLCSHLFHKLSCQGTIREIHKDPAASHELLALRCSIVLLQRDILHLLKPCPGMLLDAPECSIVWAQRSEPP